MFKVDQAHENIDIFGSKMTQDVWRSKYRWQDEESPLDSFERVATAIFPDENEAEYRERAYAAMSAGLWQPGGRIIAGAGTPKRVTLMNCYVNKTVEDSMEGITSALSNTMFTLQQGGGIGTDFSTLRPEGALLTRTQTKASGPIPFMHTWDAASRTIRSAGDRRGAMMGTMSDTHPDLLKFIAAKQQPGVLTQFNVSVLVSDALMEAVREDEDWLLYFNVPPVERDDSLEQYDFVDDNDVKQYVYAIHKAREIWEIITRATYEYSEPGVIFIDRINDLNNLWYLEDIRCTNPCGEQPLPPHGTCNLGHINLARVVVNPFTPEARINHELIREVTEIGVRFLDKVIDVTKYPVIDQELEETQKRRLGLGFTGLADMLAQLGVRYGSPDAVRITEEVTRTICITAYNASVDLAKEKGPFPLYNPDKHFEGFSFVNTVLPQNIRDRIKEHGIRNSLLLTVAPTGTGSILFGNVSAGGEPVFLHQTERRILKPTSQFKDEWETYIEYGYGAKLWQSIHGDKPLPSYMVTAEDLSVEDHVVMQAAAQRWIDASMSKTVNIPKEMPYEQFIKVYELAYSLGCKGCTTYRPSDIRGSVLSAPGSSSKKQSGGVQETLHERPDTLDGRTYKIKWPTLESALYLTINSDGEGRPFEVFVSSKDARYHDWTTALTVMMTAIFRKGGDISFVPRELQQVQSLRDGALKDGQYHKSLVAYLGYILEKHISGENQAEEKSNTSASSKEVSSPVLRTYLATPCPNCSQQTLIKKEGCTTCMTCSYTSCG